MLFLVLTVIGCLIKVQLKSVPADLETANNTALPNGDEYDALIMNYIKGK
jgi:hypothetical protein